MRPAASPIGTGPTVPQMELLQATASCIGQFKWTAGLLCVVTTFSTLLERRHQKHRFITEPLTGHFWYILNNYWHTTTKRKFGTYLQTSVKVGLATGPDLTDPNVFHRFALAVSARHPSRHSSSTGPGAGWPGAGLGHTIHSSDHDMAHWATPESCIWNKNKVWDKNRAIVVQKISFRVCCQI